MKNKKDKKGIRLSRIVSLVLLTLCSLFTYTSVYAADVAVYSLNNWDAFKRSKQDIVNEYDRLLNYVTDEKMDYAINPSVVSPFNAGQLNDYTHKAMTDYANFYRYLAGVPQFSSRSTHLLDLQTGALVRYIYYNSTGRLAHYGIDASYKPPGMSDAMWNLGANASNNILAAGPSPMGSINAWVNEGGYNDQGHFDPNHTGHRSAIMSPKRTHIDFGYVGSLAIGRVQSNYYHDTMITPFPAAGYMPNNFVNAYYAGWSLELNNKYLTITDNTKVTVTNLRTNYSYTCEIGVCAVRDKYDNNTLLFAQPRATNNGTYAIGDKYRVYVTGLRNHDGKEGIIDYTTEFFDIDKPSVSPSKAVSKIEVTQIPNKTTYLYSEVDVDNPEASIDLTGGKLKVTFGDNSTKEIDLEDANVVLETDYSGYPRKLNVAYDEENTETSTYISLLTIDDSRFNYPWYTTYGKKLLDLQLPSSYQGTYEWIEDANTPVGDADEIIGYADNIHKIRFVPYGSIYNSIELDAIVRVAQVDAEYVVPTGLKAYVGTSAEDISLPQGFELEDAYRSAIIREGNNRLYVKYIPNDPKNYKKKNYIEVNVEGIKVPPSYVAPTGLTATYGNTLYDVERQLNAFNTSDGTFKFKDDLDTLVGDAGEREFTVIYTPTDSKYSTVEVEVKINVNKAMASDVIIPYVSTITYNPNKTLGDVKLPGGWNWVDETIVPTVNNSGYDIVYTPSEENLKNYDYSNVQLTKHIVVNVEKADPTYTVPTDIKAYKDMTLADVELPSGFTWKDSTINVGDTGEHEFLATYTPSDLDNYNIIENIKIKVSVGKAKPSFTVPTDLVATYGDTLADITLPSVANGTFSFAKDASTSVGNAGENQFTLIFTPNDLDNYDVVETKVIVKVNKANGGVINPPVVSPITYNPNTKLENVALSEGWVWDNKTIVPTVNNSGYAATYKNADTNNYYYQGAVNTIVNLVVNKARPNIPSKLSLIGYKTMTLASVVLPESEDGVYSWNSDVDTELVLGTMTFSAKFTPNDINNYEVIDNIEVIVEVSKMRPTFTIPTDLVATYGDTLDSISLPQGFTWNNPTDLVGNAGENKFFVTYTPDDTENYAIVSDIPVIVKVNKKIADLVTIPTVDTEYVYSPNNNLGKIDLGEGWTWDDPSIVPTVGNSGYKATYTPVDSNNYDYSNQDLNPTILVKVIKGTYDYEIPTDVWAYWGDTLKDVYLPLGFTFQDSLDTSVGEVGYQEFKVTYTPTDLNNYNISKDIVIKVLIEKKWPEIDGLDEITVDYKDGMTLGNIKLPEGWSWYNSGCLITETDYYEVVYTPKDTDHYATIYDIVRVVVKKPLNTNVSTNKGFYGNGSVYGESSNKSDNSLASSDNDKEIKADAEDEKDTANDEDDDSETSSTKFPWWILILVVVIIALVIGYTKYSESK